jgi:hypothetical protein
MRWRDIRFEPPTKADGDEWRRILILHKNGYFALVSHENASSGVAWMPLSELPAFDRIPDPPEGWRFADAGEAFDKRAKYWDYIDKDYRESTNKGLYSYSLVYIVPIDPPTPPEPQYRPYNAAELKLLIGKVVDGVVGYTAEITGAWGDFVYCQGQKVSAEALLRDHAWTDGGKCGVEIDQ